METIECSQCTFINKSDNLTCEICNTNFTKKIIKITDDTVGNILKSLQLKNKIEQNKMDAYNIIPECMFQVDMLYFKCKINDSFIEAFVDTGAQMSIMSESCAKLCGLSDLIDYSYQGVAKGVGQQTILGKIWLIDILVENIAVPCSFTILKNMDIDMIFGLDMLNSHRANINLKDKRIELDGGVIIPIIKKNTIH